MRIIFAIVCLLCLFDVEACEIQLPDRIIVSGVVSNHLPFTQQGCSAEQLQELRATIQDHDGELPLARLQAAVGDSIKLHSAQPNTQVQRLADIISTQFPQSKDVDMEINDVESDIIALDGNSEVQLKCHPCLFNGNEVIRLQVRSYQAAVRDYNFNAHFSRHVLAARAKITIQAFSGHLDEDQFEMVKVPQVAYGRYQTDISKIKYFKPNKTIRAGEFLRESDIVPLTLVRAGDKVDLFFENDHVRVKSHATSRQSGGMGDKIDIWNQANGKKYRGIITDHNKVLVEL